VALFDAVAIARVDTVRAVLLDTLPAGAAPRRLAAVADGVWAVNSGDSTLSLLAR
jgi:hypothetical protein